MSGRGDIEVPRVLVLTRSASDERAPWLRACLEDLAAMRCDTHVAVVPSRMLGPVAPSRRAREIEREHRLRPFDVVVAAPGAPRAASRLVGRRLGLPLVTDISGEDGVRALAGAARAAERRRERRRHAAEVWEPLPSRCHPRAFAG